MGTFLTALRVALRQWRHHPAAALVIILSIATGIGANATVFAWIDGVILRPLPGTTPGREILAFENRAPDGTGLPSSWLDYRDYRDNTKSAEIAGASGRVFVLRDPQAGAGEGAQVWGQLVSGNYFEVLGVKPALGRFFSDEERADRPGGAPVVVISGRMWREKFASDPNVLGRVVELNRVSLTIVGVTPEAFRGCVPALGFDLYVPLTMVSSVAGGNDELNFEDRKTRWFDVLAHPRPGFTGEQAGEELRAICARLARDFPRTNEGVSGELFPLWRVPYGPRALLGPLFGILQGAAALLFAVVCANVANLLLALGAARRREFALRLALGAGRGRVIRQLLLELSLLAAVGAAGGVLLSGILIDLLSYFSPSTRFPLELSPTVDSAPMLLAIGLAVLTVLTAGLVPAWQAAHSAPLSALRESGASAGPQSAFLRGTFVVAQIALALVALVAAGLFHRSFIAAQNLDPGFRLDDAVVVRLNPSAAGYDAAGSVAFLNRLRARLDAAPGVKRSATSDFVPLGLFGGPWEDLTIAGYTPPPEENMKIRRNAVSPGHLEAMGLRLLAGRDIAESDTPENARVALVNETFVRRYLAGREPLGQTFIGWGMELTIVGVVNDAKVASLTESPVPFFWVPMSQFYRPQNLTWVQVRSAAPLDPAATLGLVRREIAGLDPAMPVFEALSLREYVSTSYFQQRIAANLLSGLGALTLLLAALGLYGVVSYSVQRRTREVGVRMALGAQAGDVVRLVLGQGLRLIGLGVGLGILLAVASSSVLGQYLVGISAFDPLVFGVVAAALSVIAILATLLPARRATLIDPAVALRVD